MWVPRELDSDALREQCTCTCSAHACTRPATAAYQLGAYAVHVHVHVHMHVQLPRRAQDVFASQRLPRNYLLLAASYVPRLSHRRSGYHLLLAPCYYLLLAPTCYLLLATCSLPEVFASALFRMRCIAVVSPSGIRQSSKGCSTVRGVAR